MGKIRRVATLWNNTATGAAGKSAVATIGAATNVTIFVTVDGATNITVELAPGSAAAARNEVAGITVWHTLYKSDGSGVMTIALAGAGSVAINISPFGAEHIRLSSSAAVNATAYVDAI